MSLLFKTLKHHRQRFKGILGVFLFLTLIISVAGVVMIRLTGDMGQAALDFDVDTIIRFLILLTVLMAIRAISSAVSALMLGRFAGKVGYGFRDNFARFFLQKPFAAFESTSSGESLSVFTNDLPNAVELVSGGGLRMIADFVSLIVTIVYMMLLHWWLSLIFFASFPVLIAVQVLFSIPIQKQSEKRLAATANLTAVINDSFQNTSTVAAYSLENEMEKRTQLAYDQVISATRSHVRAFAVLILTGIVASVSPLLIVTAIAAGQTINGYLNIAEFIAFIGLAGEAGSWLSMLSQRQNNVQTTAAGAKRLLEHITGDVEDIEDSANTGSTRHYSDVAISASNLSFAYPGDADAPLVLDDISFQITKGSRIAFVGSSGSGKSTILKLLIGLYSPKEGQININGASTADISLRNLRDSYAYVPQDSFLFPETIAENITGKHAITDMPRLEKACSDAGILEFIQGLPGGFDTVLSESGENISGGQKQRVALARAFYKDAPVILFDEATSALDPITEAEVLQSFDNLAKDKTVIMVAHRLKAINFCDTIMVMDGGKLVSMGTHNKLINTCPIYLSLYESQQKEVQ